MHHDPSDLGLLILILITMYQKSSTNLSTVIPQYSVALGSRGFSQGYNLNNPWDITLYAITYLVIFFLAWNESLDKHIIAHLVKQVTQQLRYNGSQL